MAATGSRWLVRAWWAIGALQIVAVVWLSLAPAVPQLPGESGDKLGHVLAYGTMMLWFSEIHATRRARIVWAAGFVAMGIAIEYLQRLTGYRSFEAADMAADAIGVAAGWLLAPPRTPDLFAFVCRALRRGRMARAA